MFYSLLKSYARLAIRVYCRKIVINRPEMLQSRGPLLLAANHPNSFLDGIILTTLFDQPVHSLARGDAFTIPWVNRFLRSIQLLPVYRTSEGVENLEHNYTTFAACQETFRENGIVLIFSEGRCENEWHLRPLKKGTARLAIEAWEQGVPLLVVPTAFNYSSFKKFGKEVHLFFGEAITHHVLDGADSSGKKILAFNDALQQQLRQLVYEIDPADKPQVRRIFSIRIEPSFYALLLPALAGILIHAPIFIPVKLFTELRFRKSGHYDSVLHSLLLILYPVYLVLLTTAAVLAFSGYGFLVFLISPLTAWACTHAKYQVGL